METKLFKHEVKAAWKGFGVINLLIVITLMCGLPVQFHSEGGLTMSTSRASYTQIVLLSFLALLIYGMYQLFRELYVSPSGLIFTVPADVYNILFAKMKSACLLAVLSVIVLHTLGLTLQYTEGPTLSIIYLIACSYTVMLSAGFKRIALCHRQYKNVTGTITAAVATVLKGAAALAIYMAGWQVLLYIVMVVLGIASWLVVIITIVASGIPLFVKAKVYLRQASEILAPGGAA